MLLVCTPDVFHSNRGQNNVYPEFMLVAVFFSPSRQMQIYYRRQITTASLQINSNSVLTNRSTIRRYAVGNTGSVVTLQKYVHYASKINQKNPHLNPISATMQQNSHLNPI
jgi:hypothetical protein